MGWVSLLASCSHVDLLRAIDDISGQFVTLCALKLAPLVFVRPGELRQAQWPEFDLDEAMWRIPASGMKMKVAHLVPLSTRVVPILRDLHAQTGHGENVLPDLRSARRYTPQGDGLERRCH